MSTLYYDALLKWLSDHPHYTHYGHTSAEIATATTEHFNTLRVGQKNRIIKQYDTEDCELFIVRKGFECWSNERLELMAKTTLEFHQQRLRDIQLVMNKKATDNKSYFVTIGFNHQTWDILHCCELIQRVLDASWVLDGKAVFELYRANGEHPHAHFILNLENPMPKSKVVEKIFKLKGMKKLVLKKSFIDIKETNEQHKLYITGIKQESKMPFVNLDDDWRAKNNLPKMFQSKKLLG